MRLIRVLTLSGLGVLAMLALTTMPLAGEVLPNEILAKVMTVAPPGPVVIKPYTLVKAGAGWCGPCQNCTKGMNQGAQKLVDACGGVVKIVQLNVDDPAHQRALDSFGKISGVPALIGIGADGRPLTDANGRPIPPIIGYNAGPKSLDPMLGLIARMRAVAQQGAQALQEQQR